MANMLQHNDGKKLVRHTRRAPPEEQEKNAGAGFNGIVVAPHQSLVAEGKNKHLIKQRPTSRKGRTMKPGCETSMKHSKKSDKHLRRVSTTLDALLIRRNFLRKHVSNIVECSGREFHYTA
jgi:hypothetical protein